MTLVINPMMPIALAPVKVRQSSMIIRFCVRFCPLGCSELANCTPAGMGVAVGSGVKTGAKATGTWVGVAVTTT